MLAACAYFSLIFFVTPVIDPRDRGRRLSQHTKSRKNEFYDLSLQIVNFQTWNLLSFKIYLAKSWIANVWIWPSAANFRSFRRFHFENVANVFRPDYPGEIWKRNNHRPFWICVWGKLGQGNHGKGNLVHAKTKSRRFQIPPVWRAPFSWRISVDDRPNRRKKAVFPIIFSGVV